MRIPWGSFFSRFASKRKRHIPSEVFDQLRWIEADDNPFNVKIFDCRPYALAMISFSDDKKVAEHFALSRSSEGEQYRGSTPANSVHVECKLRYPVLKEIREGPIFKAREMEDKWDIYFYDGYLYFVRSWTGDLSFKAKGVIENLEITIPFMEVRSDTLIGDETFIIKQVDFLIKSHLCGLNVPHPLPQGLPSDPEAIAMYSFSVFGRKGLFATYEDTIPIMPEPLS